MYGGREGRINVTEMIVSYIIIMVIILGRVEVTAAGRREKQGGGGDEGVFGQAICHCSVDSVYHSAS